MASGDQLLDKDGKRLLGSDGGHSLSNGEDDTCCCDNGRCWVRWRFEHSCGGLFTDDEPIAVSVRCLVHPPEYALTWHQVSPPPNCVWFYDQELDDTCTADGDCPEAPEAPDIAPPDTSDCCCDGVCVYLFEATYYKLSHTWSAVTQVSATCEKYFISSSRWLPVAEDTPDADTCTFRARVSGACCTGDGDCTMWPSPPPFPDDPKCGCPELACPQYLITLIDASPKCSANGGSTAVKGDAPASGSWLYDICYAEAAIGGESGGGEQHYVDHGSGYIDLILTSRTASWDVTTYEAPGDIEVCDTPVDPQPVRPTNLGNLRFRLDSDVDEDQCGVTVVSIQSRQGFVVFDSGPNVHTDVCCCVTRSGGLTPHRLILGFIVLASAGNTTAFENGIVTVDLLNCPETT